jgi:[ribosomal protein S5]-alanine N-acetyltransferase
MPDPAVPDDRFRQDVFRTRMREIHSMQVPRGTDRLEFREWKRVDFEPFHAICSDPRVMRFVGKGRPWSPDSTREFIERASRLSQSHGYCQWPLIHRVDAVLIGYAGFVNSAEGPEVGWRLAPTYWGRGLATEAARRVIQHGFEVLKFPRILATVQQENVASRRIIEKLGMQRQASFQRQGRTILRYTIDKPCKRPHG